MRTSYQMFPYVMGQNTNILYKQVMRNWEVYHLINGTRNTYVSANILVHTIPTKWTPIQVIRLKKKLKGIIPMAKLVGTTITKEKRMGHITKERIN